MWLTVFKLRIIYKDKLFKGICGLSDVSGIENFVFMDPSEARRVSKLLSEHGIVTTVISQKEEF